MNISAQTHLHTILSRLNQIGAAINQAEAGDLANLDNTLEMGLLFVNKRHVLKTTWDPSTSGEYARWISRYGSVTINFLGYQMAWAGMNEAGLMISTMSLNDTQGPSPDEKLPFESPFWMQYQLDLHNTNDLFA